MIDTVLDDAGLHLKSAQATAYLKQIDSVAAAEGEYTYLKDL